MCWTSETRPQCVTWASLELLESSEVSYLILLSSWNHIGGGGACFKEFRTFYLKKQNTWPSKSVCAYVPV